MKKAIVLFIAMVTALVPTTGALARGHHSGGHRPPPRLRYHESYHRHHHHHHGDRVLGGVLVGVILGTVIANSTKDKPTESSKGE